jgi:hypothetical protein
MARGRGVGVGLARPPWLQVPSGMSPTGAGGSVSAAARWRISASAALRNSWRMAAFPGGSARTSPAERCTGIPSGVRRPSRSASHPEPGDAGADLGLRAEQRDGNPAQTAIEPQAIGGKARATDRRIGMRPTMSRGGDEDAETLGRRCRPGLGVEPDCRGKAGAGRGRAGVVHQGTRRLGHRGDRRHASAITEHRDDLACVAGAQADGEVGRRTAGC